jgi:hypothetical protein
MRLGAEMAARQCRTSVRGKVGLIPALLALVTVFGALANPAPATATPSGAGRSGFAVMLEPFNGAAGWVNIGGDHVIIQARWDRLQRTARGPLNSNEVRRLQRQINNASTAAGVIFEIAIQYPPPAVKSLVPPFVNQAGRPWTGTVGADVRDWVFSNTGRQVVKDFIDKTVAALDLSRVWAVRTGGGWYNELHYPPSTGGGISFWAYGDAPQLGVDLAFDQVSTPLPRYRYGTGTAAQDKRWALWYSGALVQFERWLIAEHRNAGWTGPLFVMHPGYGMRDSWRPTQSRWRYELAAGNDWRAQLAAYTADVHPWSTWLDAPEPYGSRDEGSEAPWRKLHALAVTRGVAGLMWGENTRGANSAATTRIFGARGPIALGYRGVAWVGLSRLTDGSAAKRTQLKNSLVRQRNLWAAR